MKRLKVALAGTVLGVLVLGSPVAGMAQAAPAPASSTAPASAPSSDSQAAKNSTAAAEQIQPKMTAMIDASTYIIGPEDSLQVTVWREPTLSGTFPVRPDGMISLALVGDLPAAGLTPMQLGTNIATSLKKFIQDPSVAVVVSAVNSKRIFVVGEVGHVGPMQMTPGMTPLQALAAAGGPTAFAHPKRIYVLRGQTGKQQKIPFDYKQALKGDTKQLFSLQPGDTIVVP